ncbi:Rv3235 family protein [Streptomyces sp. CS081A]|uniref:Rv3235 family protein n=1 Tax=Streptomyces sp. CS081A TaxID=2162709 RepID=UPI001EF6BA81|nr:Rv3235 family protein [Streptomyces sp. CS081A]
MTATLTTTATTPSATVRATRPADTLSGTATQTPAPASPAPRATAPATPTADIPSTTATQPPAPAFPGTAPATVPAPRAAMPAALPATSPTTDRAAAGAFPATGTAVGPAPAPAVVPLPLAGDSRRPRAPRPRTAPGGPAGTRPRGAAGSRPRTPGRGAPRALPPHTVFAERLLAVLSGERPVHWMLGHTLGEAYEQLVRLAPGTPLRSPGPRPVLRRCSVQAHPAQGAVEAFATIATGARVRAMAFRLERGDDQRWRCAAVELDGLGTAAAHRT